MDGGDNADAVEQANKPSWWSATRVKLAPVLDPCMAVSKRAALLMKAMPPPLQLAMFVVFSVQVAHELTEKIGKKSDSGKTSDFVFMSVYIGRVCLVLGFLILVAWLQGGILKDKDNLKVMVCLGLSAIGIVVCVTINHGLGAADTEKFKGADGALVRRMFLYGTMATAMALMIMFAMSSLFESEKQSTH